jgi:hypothetical protein
MMTLSGDILAEPAGKLSPESVVDTSGLGSPGPPTPRRVVLATSPDRPAVDPNVDTISTGLRKFNIGTVPASVTPPSTWRQAAGLSVAASAAALAGLVVLAAAVAGASKPSDGPGAVPAAPKGIEPTVTAPSSGPNSGRHRTPRQSATAAHPRVSPAGT